MDAITILPAHTGSTAAGTPILRGGGSGKRVRYTVMPLEEPTTSTNTDPPSLEPSGAGGGSYAQPPPRKLSCFICSGLLVDPVASACGHAACRQCAEGLEKCGQCGKPFRAAKPSPLTAWLVEKLEVSCPGEGCTEVGSRAHIAEHASRCGLVAVPCPRAHLGCSALVRRCDLDEHAASCPFEKCASFIASTLSRLDALEAENGRLRSELRVVSEASRWHDARWGETRTCVDCGVLFECATGAGGEAGGGKSHEASAGGEKAPCCCGGRHRGPPVRLSEWRQRKKAKLEAAVGA